MAGVNVKPLGDRVLVQPLEEQETKKGGIIIPDTAKEKPQEGKVVALGTGKEQKISITGSSGLSKDEIEKMRHEAEAHADEDKKAKEAIEIKNNADTLAYQSEKQLKELGDKVPAEKRKPVEDAIAAVREAINKNDTDAIKRAYDDLQSKFQDISAELYKQASAQAGPQPGPQPGPEAGGRPGTEQGAGKRGGDGDVVDAEFEVVDEDKKK